jgi:drug/metabolite transporter (DMT)-like permease
MLPPSVFFALIAAASWGIGDFFAGLASRNPFRRQHTALAVSLSMNAMGFPLMVAVALVAGEAWPSITSIGLGLGAGVVGSLGFVLLLEAMRIGQIGLVSPISAILTAAIPALYYAINNGWPGVETSIGFGLALLGIGLVSGGSAGRAAWLSLVLAMLSGLGFAGFKILSSLLPAQSLLWPVATARLSGLVTVLVVLWWYNRGTAPPGDPEHGSDMTFTTQLALFPWLLILGASIMDSLGNVMFLQASRAGSLDIAAVVTAMYPAMTAVLAIAVLRERPTIQQYIGTALMLGAVALIA